MIKLICLDVDGTLLNSQKQLSSENLTAIREAINEGIHVVICTGRPILGIKTLLNQLQMTDDDYVITFNGGLVQKVGSGDVVAGTTHSLTDIQHIYHTLYNVGLPINAIDKDNVYVSGYPENAKSLYPDIMSQDLILAHKNITDFDDNHLFYKAICCIDKQILDEKFALVSTALNERYNCFKSRETLMEIMPKGVDKAHGIKELCRVLNIQPSQVMAMGDEENDIPMLTHVGYGIAMGNATEDVKKVAKYITKTNDDNGVAHAIYTYALGKK